MEPLQIFATIILFLEASDQFGRYQVLCIVRNRLRSRQDGLQEMQVSFSTVTQNLLYVPKIVTSLSGAFYRLKNMLQFTNNKKKNLYKENNGQQGHRRRGRARGCPAD